MPKFGLQTYHQGGFFDLPNPKNGDVVAIDKTTGSPIVMVKNVAYNLKSGWYIQAGLAVGDLGDKVKLKYGVGVSSKKFEVLVKECSFNTPYCSHTWKTYNSGFTTFEYCETCDVKKEDYLKQYTNRYEKAYGG